MLTIGICDDNEKDLQYITALVQGIMKKVKIEYKVYSFQSPNAMLAHSENIDIGILAIVMDELWGIELGKRLKQKYPHIQIIYGTGYEKYCMAAINEVHAYSYICKPIEKMKLEQQLTGLLNDLGNKRVEKEFYGVMDGYGRKYTVVKINLLEVLYFEYIKRARKVRIVLNTGLYEYNCTLEQLADEMQNYGFAVNCRGYLVNLLHVVRVSRHAIYMDNGQELPVSQKRMAEFRGQLQQYWNQE